MRADLKEIFRFYCQSIQMWWLTRRAIRAERYIIHKRKTEWLFSGVSRDERGFFSDLGFTRSPYPMKRAQALKYFRELHPRGVVSHIDDKNKIITFTAG